MNPENDAHTILAAASLHAGEQRMEARLQIPADLPVLRGHFPGRPIVPGVLQLALIRLVAEHALGPLSVTSYSKVKWLHTLHPQTVFVVTAAWKQIDAGLRLQGSLSTPAGQQLCTMIATADRVSQSASQRADGR